MQISEMSVNCQLLSDSLLQLFIDYAWNEKLYGERSDNEAKKFRDWVSSENVDLNNENWPFLLKPVYDPECFHSQVWLVDTIQDVFYKVVCQLENVLPILFDCNGNINFIDKNGRTILHIFIAGTKNKARQSQRKIDKNLILIKSLIENGASVNIVDQHGNTPFSLAALYGQKEYLQIMLTNFTNTDTCNEHGNTALHIIVDQSLTIEGKYEKEYPEIVRSLVLKGADLTKKNNKRLTPVQLAASKYNIEVLKIFKTNGADFSILTDDGENLIFLACKDMWCVKDEMRIQKTIDFLVNEGCDINKSDNKGYFPLHYASLWDRAVKCLIIYGAKIDCRTKIHQQTPLHWAVKGYHFNLDTIKILVQAGANVNAKAADGATPLLMAAMTSSPEIVRFLIEQGANVNDKDDIFGFTPLHLAAIEKESFVLLIDKSNDIDVSSNHGVTPFHLASLTSNLDVMELLITRSAKIDCLDNLNRTLLHMVLLGNFFLNLEKLLDRFIDEQLKKVSFIDEMWSSWWCRYNSHCQTSAIELIVNTKKSDVNAKDINGRRPLHLATRDPLGSSIETLLKLGAQIDVFDQNRRLPFHEVLENENIEGLKCLLNFGVDFNENNINHLIIRSKKDIKDVFFDHLVKIDMAGLPIANVYKFNVTVAKYETELYCDYMNEIQKMKERVMDDSSMSLYEFLRTSWRRRIVLMPCKFYDACSEFEFYKKIIHSSYRKAIERQQLFGPALKAWYEITRYNLPNVCVEFILEFMTNGQLTELIESAGLNYVDT
ncbi:serine/threonine-protein phosphatase 6 regulatory ankyrin repeat subunit A-like [Phymastichus coffea]|uniref:serine/threonine-protein phosphatase 6 regulatory ankyrin repeat subunit A-like n=1 Tax=Phymastichus coffea TaxID=108790 RepID=UPI00273BBE70|nr:serine/threonine-protein phosphatase 6 regulatory ankyrin repeat subunit A-like [Phymastichus coffea]